MAVPALMRTELGLVGDAWDLEAAQVCHKCDCSGAQGVLKNRNEAKQRGKMLILFMSAEMSTKLFIGGLSWNTTDDSLRHGFSQYGIVEDAIVIKDRDTGRSRGFGFVTFADDASAQSAIDDLHEREFEGRQIKVDRAAERTSAPRNNFNNNSQGQYNRAPRFNGNQQGGYGGQGQQGRSDGEWNRQ
ncbi:hypothetical protein BGZ83_006413 [Gryganskiella cystojenkinii]|nr:hypothetical protein BGZ83_006413 [Gryganskiella cystojenkinii]